MEERDLTPDDSSQMARACRSCARPLDQDDGRALESGLCTSCAIQDAEKRLGERKSVEASRGLSRDKIREIFWLTAAVVSVTAAVLSMVWPLLPFNQQVFEPPARNGSAETDKIADECIDLLATVPDFLREGDIEAMDAELACPLSGSPFTYVWADEKREVEAFVRAECPNPTEHDVQSIFIEAGDTVTTVE